MSRFRRKEKTQFPETETITPKRDLVGPFIGVRVGVGTLGAGGYYLLLFFFASEAREERGEAASTRREAPRKKPAKRLIFSPTMRQRASGTRVWSGWVVSQLAVSHMPSKILGKEIVHISIIFLLNFFI